MGRPLLPATSSRISGRLHDAVCRGGGDPGAAQWTGAPARRRVHSRGSRVPLRLLQPLQRRHTDGKTDIQTVRQIYVQTVRQRHPVQRRYTHGETDSVTRFRDDIGIDGEPDIQAVSETASPSAETTYRR